MALRFKGRLVYLTEKYPEPIVLMRPYLPESAIDAVTQVLRSRWIGQGPKVDEFERAFSKLMYGRPAVAVNSCTSALHLAYLLAGIQPGDTVLAPLFTCTAANEALLYCGAKIQFVDVAPNSLNMDPEAVGKYIDGAKAISVVHYGGMPADMAGIAKKNLEHLPVIEDCAQALGGTYSGSRVPLGVWASYAAYSFQAVKTVTTGDGGMLTLRPWQDGWETAKAKRMRWFGIDRSAKLNGTWANDITELGYKYQMTDIAAALGLEGLKTLDWQIEHRRILRGAYRCGLTNVDGIRLLDDDPQSACWLGTVLVERREDFRRALQAQAIESDQVHYRNDRYSIFKEFRGEFPNMDAIDAKYLCLPLHMGMTVEHVERICDVVRSGW